jgi:hypothetical protein
VPGRQAIWALGLAHLTGKPIHPATAVAGGLSFVSKCLQLSFGLLLCAALMSGRSGSPLRLGRARLVVAASLLLAAMCGLAVPAASGDLQSELNAKRSELGQAEAREGVLSS